MSCENSVEVPVCGVKLSLDTSSIEAGVSEERVREMIGQATITMPVGDGIDYSLDEQWTGRRWVDGKKIYQKTVNCGAVGKGVDKYFPHNILNLDRVITLTGMAVSPAGGFLPVPYPAYSDLIIITGGYKESIRIQTTANASSSSIYMTIQYTCTDR